MASKIAMWTGIALTGMCGIVLLGGGKVQSGALLIVTAFVMTLLVGRNTIPVWLRAVLIAAVFGLVIANISTTQLPAPTEAMAMSCSEAAEFDSTGIEFLDQVIYIFNSFAAQAAPS